MLTLMFDKGPIIINLTIGDNAFVVHLADGRSLTIPYSWYPRLAYETAEERQNWEIFGDGYAIHWPDLDEDLAIDGLLAGNRSAERTLFALVDESAILVIDHLH